MFPSGGDPQQGQPSQQQWQQQQQQQRMASYHHQHTQTHLSSKYSQPPPSMGVSSTPVNTNTAVSMSRQNRQAPEFSLQHLTSKSPQQSIMLSASDNFHQRSNVLPPPPSCSSIQNSGLTSILPNISFPMGKPLLGPYPHQQQMPGPGPDPTSSLTANGQRWPLFPPPYYQTQHANPHPDVLGQLHYSSSVRTKNKLINVVSKDGDQQGQPSQQQWQQQQRMASYHHQHSLTHRPSKYSQPPPSMGVSSTPVNMNTTVSMSRLNPLAPEFSLQHLDGKSQQQSGMFLASTNFHQKSIVLPPPPPPSSLQNSGLVTILPYISFPMVKSSLGSYHHLQQIPGPRPAPTSSLTANGQMWPLFAPPYHQAHHAHPQPSVVGQMDYSSSVSTMTHLANLAANLGQPGSDLLAGLEYGSTAGERNHLTVSPSSPAGKNPGSEEEHNHHKLEDRKIPRPTGTERAIWNKYASVGSVGTVGDPDPSSWMLGGGDPKMSASSWTGAIVGHAMDRHQMYRTNPSHYGQQHPSDDLPHMMDTTFQVDAAKALGYPGNAVCPPVSSKTSIIPPELSLAPIPYQASGGFSFESSVPHSSGSTVTHSSKQQAMPPGDSNVMPSVACSGNQPQSSHLEISPSPIVNRTVFQTGELPPRSVSNHQPYGIMASSTQASLYHNDLYTSASSAGYAPDQSNHSATLLKMVPSAGDPQQGQPSQQQLQILASDHHQHTHPHHPIKYSQTQPSVGVSSNTTVSISRLNPLAPEFSLQHLDGKSQQQSRMFLASTNFHQRSIVLPPAPPPSSLQNSGLVTILPYISFPMVKSSLGSYHHQQQIPGPRPAPTSSLTANGQMWPLFAPPYHQAHHAHPQPSVVGQMDYSSSVSTMTHLANLAANLGQPGSDLLAGLEYGSTAGERNHLTVSPSSPAGKNPGSEEEHNHHKLEDRKIPRPTGTERAIWNKYASVGSVGTVGDPDPSSWMLGGGDPKMSESSWTGAIVGHAMDRHQMYRTNPSHYGQQHPSDNLPHMMDTTFQADAAKAPGYPGNAVCPPVSSKTSIIPPELSLAPSFPYQASGGFSFESSVPHSSGSTVTHSSKQQAMPPGDSNVMPSVACSGNQPQSSHLEISPSPIVNRTVFQTGELPPRSVSNHQPYGIMASSTQASLYHNDLYTSASSAGYAPDQSNHSATLLKMVPSAGDPQQGQPSQQQLQILASDHYQHTHPHHPIKYSQTQPSVGVSSNTTVSISRLNPLAPEFSLQHLDGKSQQQSRMFLASTNFHQRSNVLPPPPPPSSLQNSGLVIILPYISFPMVKSSLGSYHHQQQIPGPRPAPTSSLTANGQMWPLFAPPYHQAHHAHPQPSVVGQMDYSSSVSTMDHLANLAANLGQPGSDLLAGLEYGSTAGERNHPTVSPSSPAGNNPGSEEEHNYHKLEDRKIPRPIGSERASWKKYSSVSSVGTGGDPDPSSWMSGRGEPKMSESSWMGASMGLVMDRHQMYRINPSHYGQLPPSDDMMDTTLQPGNPESQHSFHNGGMATMSLMQHGLPLHPHYNATADMVAPESVKMEAPIRDTASHLGMADVPDKQHQWDAEWSN